MRIFFDNEADTIHGQINIEEVENDGDDDVLSLNLTIWDQEGIDSEFIVDPVFDITVYQT